MASCVFVRSLAESRKKLNHDVLFSSYAVHRFSYQLRFSISSKLRRARFGPLREVRGAFGEFFAILSGASLGAVLPSLLLFKVHRKFFASVLIS